MSGAGGARATQWRSCSCACSQQDVRGNFRSSHPSVASPIKLFWKVLLGIEYRSRWETTGAHPG